MGGKGDDFSMVSMTNLSNCFDFEALKIFDEMTIPSSLMLTIKVVLSFESHF